MKTITLLSIASLTLAPFASVRANPISASDLLLFQAGSSASDIASADATSEVIDEINPSLSNQTIPVQAFDISTMSNPLYTSNDGSDGDLTLSDNGTLLSFSGWTSSNGSAAENLVGGRGAGTLNANGTFTLAATYTGSTTAGNQTRAAYSPDGVNWYFADKGGVYTQGSSTPLAGSLNTRSIHAYGGSVYGLDASSTASVKVVGTITPSTPDGTDYTYGGLSGLVADNNAVDFALVSSGNSGTGVYDTLYYADSTADSIVKYSLHNGSWVAEGSDSLGGSFKLSQMTAETVAGGVDIFFTSNPSSGDSVLDEVTDSAAFNSTIAGSTPATLYTAPAGDDLRGVSLAPQAVPEPGTYGIFALGAALLIARSRRIRRGFGRA
jgi:hypothetical protein